MALWGNRHTVYRLDSKVVRKENPRDVKLQQEVVNIWILDELEHLLLQLLDEGLLLLRLVQMLLQLSVPAATVAVRIIDSVIGRLIEIVLTVAGFIQFNQPFTTILCTLLVHTDLGNFSIV